MHWSSTLTFELKSIKCPACCSYRLKYFKTFRTVTLTLLNFSRYVSTTAFFVGSRRNLSWTFISYDCHH